MNQTLDSRPVQIVMVTQAHNLDAGQYTFNYVTGWASQAAGDQSAEQVVRATGQRVIDAVDKILSHTQPGLGGPSAVDALESDVHLKIVTGLPRWEPEPASTAVPVGRAQRASTAFAAGPTKAVGLRR
ncbi:MAG TPA: hypothetical protein PLB21_04815 [Actinomycetota bacterium]|nr:hypothetical protein [Actinomycetota bacterium]